MSQSRTNCLSKLACARPGCHRSAGQYREESGVSTSSTRVIAPVVGSVPNSSLVSARITPRSRAIASARAYTASVSSAALDAASAPTVSTTVSNGTFSSWSPARPWWPA